jgi:hypothetical protein
MTGSLEENKDSEQFDEVFVFKNYDCDEDDGEERVNKWTTAVLKKMKNQGMLNDMNEAIDKRQKNEYKV